MEDPHITEEQGRILMDSYRQNEATQALIKASGAGEVQGVSFPSSEQKFLLPEEIGPHEIEGVTIHRGMIAIDGWARAGAPAVLCDDAPAPTYSFRMQRPDLTKENGPAAIFWGFTLRAVIGPNDIERSQISLMFANGAKIRL